jgi:hypothetical protein
MSSAMPRTKMTRDEIIEKTLIEMGPLEPENEPPYAQIVELDRGEGDELARDEGALAMFCGKPMVRADDFWRDLIEGFSLRWDQVDLENWSRAPRFMPSAKFAASTVTIYLAALRFFYTKTLKRTWSTAETPYSKKVSRPPDTLDSGDFGTRIQLSYRSSVDRRSCLQLTRDERLDHLLRMVG